MPPLAGKSKPKARDGRQSPSRNTTPSSIASLPFTVAVLPAASTAYLDIPVSSLILPPNITYDDILERHGGGGGIPDPKNLELMASDLNSLSISAETRGQACDGAMRELAKRRKERIEADRMKEIASREAEEKENLKRVAEEDDDGGGKKAERLKKRKDRINVKEERPLAHGAHGVARQDGGDLPVKGSAAPQRANGNMTSPRNNKRKVEAISGSSSSLSPASAVQSPRDSTPAEELVSPRISPAPSCSSIDSRQPHPAPSIAQYQTFGPDPLTYDDPTIYHIRAVTDDLTDEEKKEIYCVAQFPHDDLSHLIAGTPPDKDFSSAKPTNQVNANTFAAYIEPYLRPLTEEDMAFLKERGDRTTPFIMPRRGKRHYSEIWAEEDGHIFPEGGHQTADKLPPNQGRGSLEQIDDDIAETDQISGSPLLNRLLSTMRFENRISPNDEREKPNGISNSAAEGSSNSFTNLASTSDNAMEESKASLPPATFMPESNSQSWKTPTLKLDHHQMDERLKVELRHIGFFGPESEPDYDAHYDDEVAERLRILQAELKRVSIVNGARKSRVLELANERMAYQEYSTILEDLDSQVQQVYLKRTRTLGKSKKNTKRPGGAGGGSHLMAISGGGAGIYGALGSGGSAGMTKPGIGDLARQLMERRKKWVSKIGPIFGDDVTRVRGKEEGIFEEALMEPLMKAELERWDEEAE